MRNALSTRHDQDGPTTGTLPQRRNDASVQEAHGEDGDGTVREQISQAQSFPGGLTGEVLRARANFLVIFDEHEVRDVPADGQNPAGNHQRHESPLVDPPRALGVQHREITLESDSDERVDRRQSANPAQHAGRETFAQQVAGLLRRVLEQVEDKPRAKEEPGDHVCGGEVEQEVVHHGPRPAPQDDQHHDGVADQADGQQEHVGGHDAHLGRERESVERHLH